MAELTGIFATPHAPPLVRDWNSIAPARRAGLGAAFAELGRRITAARPDVLVMIGADHWANFFLSNMPGIALGCGELHDGPPERWLADYPHRAMAGHAAFGQHLATVAYGASFEPSLCYQLALDHSFCVPLWKSGLDPLPAIVPVIINAMEAPLPSMRRCYEFGTVLKQAIDSFPAPLRVAVLASGGLSHSVGEPAMGDIDEDFDRACLARFGLHDPQPLFDFLSDARVARAGNGASETRFWAVAHGVAAARGFEHFYYGAIPEVYTGCAFAEWRLTP
ncbi:MAG: 2,3-dihydroxyphenylpropionate 1,2-dioxygenase [Pseudomonadota bacterium]